MQRYDYFSFSALRTQKLHPHFQTIHPRTTASHEKKSERDLTSSSIVYLKNKVVSVVIL